MDFGALALPGAKGDGRGPDIGAGGRAAEMGAVGEGMTSAAEHAGGQTCAGRGDNHQRHRLLPIHARKVSLKTPDAIRIW